AQPAGACSVLNDNPEVLSAESGLTTPKGLRRPAQGCRLRLPWVRSRQLIATLKGLRRRYERPKSDSGTRTQPRWGWRNINRLPRVAADGNPGLDDATPSGLSAPDSGLNTQDSALRGCQCGLKTRIRTQNSELRTQNFFIPIPLLNFSCWQTRRGCVV